MKIKKIIFTENIKTVISEKNLDNLLIITKRQLYLTYIDLGNTMYFDDTYLCDGEKVANYIHDLLSNCEDIDDIIIEFDIDKKENEYADEKISTVTMTEVQKFEKNILEQKKRIVQLENLVKQHQNRKIIKLIKKYKGFLYKMKGGK